MAARGRVLSAAALPPLLACASPLAPSLFQSSHAKYIHLLWVCESRVYNSPAHKNEWTSLYNIIRGFMWEKHVLPSGHWGFWWGSQCQCVYGGGIYVRRVVASGLSTNPLIWAFREMESVISVCSLRLPLALHISPYFDSADKSVDVSCGPKLLSAPKTKIYRIWKGAS